MLGTSYGFEVLINESAKGNGKRAVTLFLLKQPNQSAISPAAMAFFPDGILVIPFLLDILTFYLMKILHS